MHRLLARLLSGALVLLAVGCGGGGGTNLTTTCTTGTLCQGSCVDTATDVKNCGSCGNACEAGDLCSSGACAASCGAGQTACPTADPTYCATTTSDPSNCGGCGNTCPAGQSCANSACTCPAATPNACGSGSTASCVNFQTDPHNCGVCGKNCASGDVCSDGTCAKSCSAGQTACPTANPSYCAATASDANNCGSCGNVCPAGEGCTNSACACPVATPNACGSGSGASCVNFQTDPQNCGACGKSCASGDICSNGGCGKTCSAGQTACPTANPSYCATTTSDANNCGGCGNVCPAGQLCTNGACACPGATPNACGSGSAASCVNFQTDPQNCGTCGAACPSGDFCSSGTCTRSCSDGQTACPLANPSFCAATSTDASNCGGCGNVCPGGQACTDSACACPAVLPNACGSGATATCVDFQTDSQNCGNCGAACKAGQACSGGSCVCTTSAPDACGTGASAICTNVKTDPANCGACGVACAAAQDCTGGTCSNTSFSSIAPLPIPTSSAQQGIVSGAPSIIQDQTPGAAGDLLTPVFDISGYWYLYASQDDGQTWSYIQAPSPSTQTHTGGICQDTVNYKVHFLSNSNNNSGSLYYSRLALAHDVNGHVTGWTWDAQEVLVGSAPTDEDATDVRFQIIPAVDGLQNNILVLAYLYAPQSFASTLAMLKTSATAGLSPTSTSDFVLLDGATPTSTQPETVVTTTPVDTGSGSNCGQAWWNIHDMLIGLAQHPLTNELYVFRGPAGDPSNCSGTANQQSVVLWQYMADSADEGFTPVTTPAGTVLSAGTASQTAHWGGTFPTEDSIWICFVSPSGPEFDRVLSNGTYQANVLPNPDGTGSVAGYISMAVSADQAGAWATWVGSGDTYGDTWSAHWNGALWDNVTQVSNVDMSGFGPSLYWRGGLAVAERADQGVIYYPIPTSICGTPVDPQCAAEFEGQIQVIRTSP